MSMKRISLIFALITALAVFVSGCKPPPTFDMAKAEVAKTSNTIHQKEAEDIPPPAPVVTMSGPYVDTQRVSLQKPPGWLKQRVVAHGNKLPFVFYVDQLLGETGTHIRYDKTIDKKLPVSLDYSGSIQGALEELATVTDYNFEIDNKKDMLTWSALVSKMFSIKFLPGTTNYELGQTLELESDDSGGGSSSSSSSSGSGSISAVTDNQYSRLTGTISIWNDIQDSVSKMLSPEGNVTVSQGTTTIAVSDHPANVHKISKYIRRINSELGKQVRVQVQVLDVQLSDDYAYGINWQIVRQFISNTSQSALGLAAPGFTSANLSTITPTTFSFVAASGNFANTSTLINALQQQGSVSVVTQPSLTTLNNQVAQISIQELENYVSGSSTTSNDNGNTGGPQTSTVTTGLNMYLLPKVIREKVYLQISTVLSNLVSLESFNVFTGDQSSSGTSSGTAADVNTPTIPDTTTDGSNNTNINLGTTGVQTPNFVQLPKVDARLINQRAVIRSGETLILAGYKQFQNSMNNNKFLESDRLGGQSSLRTEREILFLITPTVIEEEEYLEGEDEDTV